jgi:hypothetical protein
MHLCNVVVISFSSDIKHMQQIAANCGNGYNFLEGVESYEKKKTL